jgi:general secretion pathway protein J
MCRSKRAGFTLVELLVALAIFAILSAFAYRGLATMLDSREALQRETRKWRDVTLLIGRIERDLAAVLDRSAIATSGVAQAAMSSALEAGNREGLAFTRSGSPLQENALAAPQRIAYRFTENRIERLTWSGVDVSPREAPTAVPLLRDVAGFAYRFLDARGEWRPSWGLPGSTEGLPAAVEVTVTLASGERIVRLVDLPRSP